MSVKELRQQITASGLPFADCIEKADLRQRAREAVAALREPSVTATPATGGGEVRIEIPAAGLCRQAPVAAPAAAQQRQQWSDIRQPLRQPLGSPPMYTASYTRHKGCNVRFRCWQLAIGCICIVIFVGLGAAFSCGLDGGQPEGLCQGKGQGYPKNPDADHDADAGNTKATGFFGRDLTSVAQSFVASMAVCLCLFAYNVRKRLEDIPVDRRPLFFVVLFSVPWFVWLITYIEIICSSGGVRFTGWIWWAQFICRSILCFQIFGCCYPCLRNLSSS
jgi:hypothetical protein